MPIGLLMLGLLLLVTAMRGTSAALGKQLKLDLLGDGQQSGFIVWVIILAILAVVGSMGASYGRKDVRVLAQLFMVVILAALVLRTPNFFQSFTDQITSGKTVAPAKDTNITAPNSASGDILEGVAGDNKGNAKSQEVLGIKTSDIETYGKYASYAVMLL